MMNWLKTLLSNDTGKAIGNASSRSGFADGGYFLPQHFYRRYLSGRNSWARRARRAYPRPSVTQGSFHRN